MPATSTGTTYTAARFAAVGSPPPPRSWFLTITTAPRTKKNSQRLVRPGGGKARPIPSKPWERWMRTAEILDERGEPFVRITEDAVWMPRDVVFNARAHFYRDASRGDMVGYMQGLADLLEKRGVLANDAAIRQWDGSRLLLDRKRPRVELWLTEVV